MGGNQTVAGSMSLNGNLNFANANPTINSSSYFVAPGGAYFNSGTVYAEAPIQARGGIHNDTNTYLTISGGTSGDTYFPGKLGIGTSTPSGAFAVQPGAFYYLFNAYGLSGPRYPACPATTPAGSSFYTNTDYGSYCWYNYIGFLGFTYSNGYQKQGTTPAFFNITAQGSVGIGTTTPQYVLDVAGSIGAGYLSVTGNINAGNNITATGTVSAGGVVLTSDLRFKRDIQVLDHSLEKILRLRGVSYQWRSEAFPERHFNDRTQIGVIAQEIEQEYPELVNTDKNGYKAVNYPALVSPLIESTKELYGMTKALTRELASVQAESVAKDQKIKELELRLDKIEKSLKPK